MPFSPDNRYRDARTHPSSSQEEPRTGRRGGRNNNPAARDSGGISPEASRSGAESEYNRPRGGMVLRKELNAAIVRTMRRQGGSPGTAEDRPQIVVLLRNSRQITRLLLKHRHRGNSRTADTKQLTWHDKFHERIEPLTQSIWGLCRVSQGCPRTMGV